MERLAQQSGKSERAVAEAVLAAARQPNNSMVARTARLLPDRPGPPAARGRARPSRPARASASPGHRNPARLAPARCSRPPGAAGTAALLTWARHPLAEPAGLARLGGGVPHGLAGLRSRGIALIHRLIAESTRIQPLARLDFSAGIPPEHRVLVVIPSMLSSIDANGELAHRLHLHWLASREANAQFAPAQRLGRCRHRKRAR